MSYRDIAAKFNTNHTKIGRLIASHQLRESIKVLLNVCLRSAPNINMYTENELNSLDMLQKYVNEGDKNEIQQE